MCPPLSTPLTRPHHPPTSPPPIAPPPARLICMHIPRRHIPGLNPAAPAALRAGLGAGRSRASAAAGEGAAGQVGGRRTEECTARCFLRTPEVSLRPNAWGLFLYFLRVSGRKTNEKSAPQPLSFHLFRLPGKLQDFARRGRVWEAPFRSKKSRQTARAQKGPSRGAPHPLSVPRAGPVARVG